MEHDGKAGVVRRRQYCGLCGQLMFEFYRSPDGHFGLVDDMGEFRDAARGEIRCPTCRARYKLLERVDPTGVPVRRM